MKFHRRNRQGTEVAVLNSTQLFCFRAKSFETWNYNLPKFQTLKFFFVNLKLFSGFHGVKIALDVSFSYVEMLNCSVHYKSVLYEHKRIFRAKAVYRPVLFYP